MIRHSRAQPNGAPRAAKEPKGMAKAHWAEALRTRARAEITRGSIPNENRTRHPRRDRTTDNAPPGPTSAERGPETGATQIRGGAIPPDSLGEPTATPAGNLGTSAESALKPSNAINVAARAISPPTAPTKVKPVWTPVAIFGSLGVCIYVPASRHWLISYSPIHLT